MNTQAAESQAINAHTINDKRFRTKLNGYSTVEVDEFLSEMADEFTRQDAFVSDLKAKNAALAKSVASYNDMERALRESLVTAQKTALVIIDDARVQAREIVESARAQAKRMTDEAEISADELMQRSREETKSLYDGEQKLREQIDEYKRRIRQVMSEQLSAMERILGDIDKSGEPRE